MLLKETKTTNQKPAASETVQGPGKVPVQLQVNGAIYSIIVEPRRTLLEALRVDFI